jgi:hydrogenase maturation factor
MRPIPKNIKKINESELNIIENNGMKMNARINVIMSEYKVEANIIPNKISFNDIG